MNITPARLAANRANAKKSTGPRTAAGKAKSSFNAIKHGLFSRHTVLCTEDKDEFRRFRRMILMRFKRRGIQRCAHLEEFIGLSWRSRRLHALSPLQGAGGVSRFIRAEERLALAIERSLERIIMAHAQSRLSIAPSDAQDASGPTAASIRRERRCEKTH